MSRFQSLNSKKIILSREGKAITKPETASSAGSFPNTSLDAAYSNFKSFVIRKSKAMPVDSKKTISSTRRSLPSTQKPKEGKLIRQRTRLQTQSLSTISNASSNEIIITPSQLALLRYLENKLEMQASLAKDFYSSGIVKRSQEKRSDVIRKDSGYFAGDSSIAAIPSELTTSSMRAADKSNAISVSSSKRNINRSFSSSNSQMHARIMRGLRSSIFFSDTRIGEEDFAQLLNSLRPSISSSELIFLHTVREQGLRRAAFLAAIFQWQFQRPLKALLGMTDARGRSYTKAKRKAKDALKRCEVRG